MRFHVRFRRVFRRIFRMGKIIRTSKDFLKAVKSPENSVTLMDVLPAVTAVYLVLSSLTLCSPLFSGFFQFDQMFLSVWKEECHVQKLKVDHHTPEDFTRCCWQKTEKVLPLWIAYRTVIFLYFLATSIYTIVDYDTAKNEKFKYVIFLTNWTYQLEMLQFFIALIITVLRYETERKNFPTAPMEKLPWHYRIYWILFIIVLPSTVVVTVIFWFSVYDPDLFPANAHNIFVHGFNSLFMFLDFVLVCHPVQFLHFYWPALYAFLYATFSLIYQLSGGTGVKGMIPIYKILDWRNPDKAALTCSLCFLFLLASYFFFSFLSIFKFWIRKKSMEKE